LQHFIVPVDGSDESWRGVDVALGLARRCSGHLEVVEVVLNADDIADADERLALGLLAHNATDVEVTAAAVGMQGDVAETLCEMVRKHPGATVVMSSQGRGRSVAFVGSVAEDLLRKLNDPVVIVGPEAKVTDFVGPIIVTVDGSDTSEAALPVAAAWSLELRTQPWIVEVVQPDVADGKDDDRAEYPRLLAQRLTALSGQMVEHEVIRDRRPDSAVAGLAEELNASLIVSSTHGRTGMPRFVAGSTASGFVRLAPCPVLLIRPPHIVTTERLSR
jgi:nucleotide-binding universal stress UspA family protein